MTGSSPPEPGPENRLLRAIAQRLLAENRDRSERISHTDEFASAAALRRSTPAPQRHWSPAPVVGYRAWRMYRNGLRGSRAWWPSPSHTASCRFDPSEPHLVPHDDGRCGRLGCGVYALKWPHDVGSVLGRSYGGLSVVLGAVALSGKVVEHEHGYRAARAEVIGAAAITRMRPVGSTDPGWIRRLFLDPVAATGEEGRELDGDVYDFLETIGRRYAESWTSVSRNE